LRKGLLLNLTEKPKPYIHPAICILQYINRFKKKHLKTKHHLAFSKIIMERFRKLGIIEPVIKTIEEERFEKPTEIQEKAIPLVLSGKDVIAGSATGSGKTLVFGAAIIQHCSKAQGIQALILTPTRELAEQVSKALARFARYKHLEVIAVYGGVAIGPQMLALRKADVVVATPGRMMDHISRGTIDLRRIRILVLDEADTMLDMGFIDDVERIIKQCPQQRQTLMFSATITPEVSELSKRYMRNPVKVMAVIYIDPSKLKQVYYDVDSKLKFPLLVHLLKHESAGLIMVFCNTRRNVDFVAKNLHANGIEAEAIHGGFAQAKRSRVMANFKSSNVYVLVCTDVAARGLDIKGVSHVYNYDIPNDSKQYIHRIGRTARAGKEGIAVNILSSRDHDNFSRVLSDRSLQIKKEEMPAIERAIIKWKPQQRRFGQVFGGDRGPPRFGPRRFGR
jgi:ATP-dependent RNA helicase DeaD